MAGPFAQPDSNIDASIFINKAAANATPANDEGRVPILEADGKLHPFFNGFRGAKAIQNASTATSSSFALHPFQAEKFDTDGYHDNVTNNSRMTIPSGLAGKYLIGATVDQNAARDTTMYLRLNGSTIIAVGGGEGIVSTTGVTVTTLYDFAAGDYIEVLSMSNGVGATSGAEVNNFWLYLVGQ